MFSSFSNTNSTAAPAGSNLFGASNTQQQQQQQPGGLFGTTQNQTQTNGLFGSTNNQGTTPNLFGNTQQPQAGGGLFGQNNAQGQNQAAAGGSLFGGQQQQPGTNLFGNTGNQPQQQGTNLFGNTTASTTNQPQQQGTSLFGAQQNQPASGGGLFGQSQSTNNASGLFGSKPGGLFGQGGGLSINTNPGANPNANNSMNNTSMFGNLGQSTQQPAANNIFGQPQQQQQQQPQLFSSTLGQQSNTYAPTNSLFGNSNLGASTLGQSALGASSVMASRTPSSTPQNQTDSAQAQFAKLAAQIEGIARAWNSGSPECRFQHYFYNFVDPSQVKMYGRPPNATHEALWQQAVRENPDPSCHVPVLAVGFDDLRQRVEAQTKKASEQQEQLKQLKERLAVLKQRHSTDNSSRLLKASTIQTQLTHRLLSLIQHLHLLIPNLRSSAIRPEEEELRGMLEDIEEELKRNRGKGKINELWALVGAINAAKERSATVNSNGSGEWVVVDEDGLAQIAAVLSEQQAGLVHITKILQKSIKDLNVVMGKSNNATDEVYEVDRDELWSTLRTSALR